MDGGFVLAAACLVSACGPSQKTVELSPSSFGLLESYRGRALLTDSIERVNELGPGEHRLRCGWIPEAPLELSIPVHLVQPDGLPFRTPAQVPDGHRVIFLASDWLEQAKDLVEGRPVDPADVLAVVLLHELGHIVNSPIANVAIAAEDRQLGVSDVYALAELRADRHAAEVIGRTPPNSQARRSAEQLKVATLVVAENIRWNYDRRYGLHGGFLTMGLWNPAKEFGEGGGRHPNLSLRFFRLAHLMEPTAERLRTLQWFLRQRRLLSGNATQEDAQVSKQEFEELTRRVCEQEKNRPPFCPKPDKGHDRR